MIFGFRQALKSLRFKPLISLFTLLSLAGSYLVLFIGSCYVEDMAVSLYSYRLRNAEQSVVATYNLNGEQITLDEVNTHLDEMVRTQDRCMVQLMREQNVNGDDWHFYLVSSSFDHFFSYRPLEGRMFTEADWTGNEPVCVIEKNRQKDKGTRVGDSITIRGQAFKVIGVIDSMLFGHAVLIPDAWTEQLADMAVRYDIYMELPGKADRFAADWETMPISTWSVMTGPEMFSEAVSRMAALVSFIGGICVLLFLYVVFATYNLLSGRFYLRVKNFSIRLMLGASYRQLTVQVYFEILILSVLAMLLVFASEPLVYSFVHETINHYFGWGTLLFMVLCAAVIPYPLSRRIMKREFRKHSISALSGGAAK